MRVPSSHTGWGSPQGLNTRCEGLKGDSIMYPQSWIVPCQAYNVSRQSARERGLSRGRASYPLFEVDPLLQGQRVSLGDDWDDVDHLAQALHEFNVQGPKPETEQ